MNETNEEREKENEEKYWNRTKRQSKCWNKWGAYTIHMLSVNVSHSFPYFFNRAILQEHQKKVLSKKKICLHFREKSSPQPFSHWFTHSLRGYPSTYKESSAAKIQKHLMHIIPKGVEKMWIKKKRNFFK